MNEIPTPSPNIIHMSKDGVPITAADALAMWDAGEAVPAIEVESEGSKARRTTAHRLATFSRITEERCLHS